MKRFRSRFERIQHVRQQQERLARIDAATRNAAVTRAESQLAVVRAQLNQTLQSQQRLTQATTTAAMLNALHVQQDCDEALVQQADKQLDEAHQTHEAALARFETARSNTRTIETLVQNERNRHKQEMRRIAEADAMERAAQQHSDRLRQADGTQA
jgi:uncharacterized protein YjhX (UPF0386 family)